MCQIAVPCLAVARNGTVSVMLVSHRMSPVGSPASTGSGPGGMSRTARADGNLPSDPVDRFPAGSDPGLTTAGCSPCNCFGGEWAITEARMSISDNVDLIRYITERGLNHGDLSFVDDVFSADYIVHARGLDLPRGSAAFRAAVSFWRGAFPDFHTTIEHMIGDGEYVA